MDANFSKSVQDDGKQKGWFSKSLFSRIHSLNGEKIILSWLCYSPATGRAFCFTCKLFAFHETMPSVVSDMSTGKMLLHESKSTKTVSHGAASLALFNRADAKNQMDNQLAQQYKAEIVYATAVLERVVAVITFLAESGSRFRGHDERLGSVHNGNFLGALESPAKFDPFIAAHIEKHGEQGRGTVSYLSSTICNELINIMGGKVLRFITDEVKEGKYFCLTVDSTPDISHVDCPLAFCDMFWKVV